MRWITLVAQVGIVFSALLSITGNECAAGEVSKVALAVVVLYYSFFHPASA